MEPRPFESAIVGAYGKLRALAQGYVHRGEVRSFEATELVHEVVLRLAKVRRADWSGHSHFFAIAARYMKRVVLDRARAARRLKRAAQTVSISLERLSNHASESELVDALVVQDAIDALARLNARQAHVAELRVYLGLPTREVAKLVGVAPRTAREDWAFARAWLNRRLKPRRTRA
ncbi:MAG: ECF-type sigma factor [Planctomycetota bacterium]